MALARPPGQGGASGAAMGSVGHPGGRTNGAEICRTLEVLMESGAPLEAVLRRAVEELHASNDRFHWTGIYELLPDKVLRLGPFVGAYTATVFIAVGRCDWARA